MSDQVGATRRRRVVAIAVAAFAAFVAVASVVQAVRQDSWSPIWSVGWLPAVLVASLSTPLHSRDCWPRRRGLSGR
jgi:hypothetical protein